MDLAGHRSSPIKNPARNGIALRKRFSGCRHARPGRPGGKHFIVKINLFVDFLVLGGGSMVTVLLKIRRVTELRYVERFPAADKPGLASRAAKYECKCECKSECECKSGA